MMSSMCKGFLVFSSPASLHYKLMSELMREINKLEAGLNLANKINEKKKNNQPTKKPINLFINQQSNKLSTKNQQTYKLTNQSTNKQIFN